MTISDLPHDFPAVSVPSDPAALGLPAVLELDLARGVARVPRGAAWSHVLAQAAMARMVPEALMLGAWPDVAVDDFVPGGRPGWPGVTRGIRPVEGGYELALVPIGHLTAGALLWPWEHAHRILHRWAGWVSELPASAASAGRLLRVPAIAGVPLELRGRAWVGVEVAIPGEPWLAAAHVAELRELSPAVDTVSLGGAKQVLGLPVGMPSPRATVGAHAGLAALPAEALDAFIDAVGPGSGSNLLSAELHSVGLPAAAYAVSAIGVPMDADEAASLEIRLGLLRAALAPWTSA